MMPELNNEQFAPPSGPSYPKPAPGSGPQQIRPQAVHARPSADIEGAFEIIDFDGSRFTTVGGREHADSAVARRRATVQAMVTRRRNRGLPTTFGGES